MPIRLYCRESTLPPLHRRAIHPAMLLSLCGRLQSFRLRARRVPPHASGPLKPAQDRSKEFWPSRMANRMRAQAVSLEE